MPVTFCGPRRVRLSVRDQVGDALKVPEPVILHYWPAAPPDGAARRAALKFLRLRAGATDAEIEQRVSGLTDDALLEHFERYVRPSADCVEKILSIPLKERARVEDMLTRQARAVTSAQRDWRLRDLRDAMLFNGSDPVPRGVTLNPLTPEPRRQACGSGRTAITGASSSQYHRVLDGPRFTDDAIGAVDGFAVAVAESMSNQTDGKVRDVDADPAPIEFLRGGNGCPAPAEGV